MYAYGGIRATTGRGRKRETEKEKWNARRSHLVSEMGFGEKKGNIRSNCGENKESEKIKPEVIKQMDGIFPFEALN